MADTLKRADGAGEPRHRGDGQPRAALGRRDAPGLPGRRPARAVAAARAEGRLAAATDCASLVEAVGGRVRLVATPGPNLKVTTPADLALAEHLLRGARDAELL